MMRLLIKHVVDGNRMTGNIIIKITIGRPIIVGVMNETNRFSFIWYLRELSVLMILQILALDLNNKGVLKILVV